MLGEQEHNRAKAGGVTVIGAFQGKQPSTVTLMLRGGKLRH